MIVPNSIKHTQVLTHAYEAVRWKSVEETLSKGGRLRRGRGQQRRASSPLPPPPAQHPLPFPAIQADPEQTLLHVWSVLMSRSLNALLHSLGELPQLLDLPQVLICLLAFFLVDGRKVPGKVQHDSETPTSGHLGCDSNRLV